MDKADSKLAVERLVSKVLTDNAALMEQFIKEGKYACNIII